MDGIQLVWKNAKKVFPTLTIGKKNGGIVLLNGTSELANFSGNVKYVENQLTIFLLGMVEGKKL